MYLFRQTIVYSVVIHLLLRPIGCIVITYCFVAKIVINWIEKKLLAVTNLQKKILKYGVYKVVAMIAESRLVLESDQ